MSIATETRPTDRFDEFVESVVAKARQVSALLNNALHRRWTTSCQKPWQESGSSRDAGNDCFDFNAIHTGGMNPAASELFHVLCWPC